MKYDVDYFIAKFEAIHEDKWCVRAFENNGTFCANGHCGVSSEFDTTTESKALIEVLKNCNLNLKGDRGGDYIGNGHFYSHKAALINDANTEQYKQPTAKQRIIAALYDIREKELSEANLKAATIIVNTETKIYENN